MLRVCSTVRDRSAQYVIAVARVGFRSTRSYPGVTARVVVLYFIPRSQSRTESARHFFGS